MSCNTCKSKKTTILRQTYAKLTPQTSASVDVVRDCKRAKILARASNLIFEDRHPVCHTDCGPPCVVVRISLPASKKSPKSVNINRLFLPPSTPKHCESKHEKVRGSSRNFKNITKKIKFVNIIFWSFWIT